MQLSGDGKTYSITSGDNPNSLIEAGLELNEHKDIQLDPDSLSEQLLQTPFGEMQGYQVKSTSVPGWKMVLQVAGSGEDGVVCLRLKLKNTGEENDRIKRFSVIANGLVPTAQLQDENFRTLDGLSGAGETQVTSGKERWSSNNLLVSWRKDSGPWMESLVSGGLTYEDFAKYVSSTTDKSGFRLNLYAEDPVGRMVEPGEEWSGYDWFYLDLRSGSPFLALENFAGAVVKANDAAPNPYNFPTVCAWYVSTPMFGNVDWMNDTPGTVREIEAARDTGFLGYSPVAVRLVPDTYDGESVRREFVSDEEWLHQYYRYKFSEDRNTEQGWWDDEHWQKFGHYAEPYETSEKWAQAILDRGGIPLTYFQVGHVSYDYAKTYPGHMIGNDISELDRIFKGHNPYVTFDYTDPGFIEHLKGVWKHLRDAGVAGLMFDYPNQAWIQDGGFEDPKATTLSAYLNVFRLAKDGLGPDSYIHERNVARKVPYLDATVGIVDSQRVWGDTDGIDPVMYRMCGLRWYKTRTLFAYDTDAKNLTRIAERSRDQLRQVLTLLYMLTGRILLANSFAHMSEEVRRDLSRVYPEHPERMSPRPVDMFDSFENPQTYVMSFSPEETHMLLSNPSTEEEWKTSLRLFEPNESGGIGLDSTKSYHAFDFWNAQYLGIQSKDQDFEQVLRPSESRIMIFRPVADHPQVLSTDRHVLQGHVELADLSWDPDSSALSGSAKLVEGEAMTISIALNGWTTLPELTLDESIGGELLARPDEDIVQLILKAKAGQKPTQSARWAVCFSQAG